MEVKGKKGMEEFAADEHPRETSLGKLATLKPVFKEDGTVTAGNASVRDIIIIIWHTHTHTTGWPCYRIWLLTLLYCTRGFVMEQVWSS